MELLVGTFAAQHQVIVVTCPAQSTGLARHPADPGLCAADCQHKHLLVAFRPPP
jgi:hypothetical protein